MSFQYKLVNGELVPLTAEEIAALEEAARHPPQSLPWHDPVALAQLANSRIDRGIEVGYDAITQVGDEIGVARRQRRQITVEDVEQQLADLVEALRSMITAQRTFEPPVPPPVEPLEPVTQVTAAPPSRKRGARR